MKFLSHRSAQIPQVVVLIVAWNPGAHLAYCIEALRVQTLRPHRIIVMNNASTDGAMESLSPQLSALINIVPLGTNIGFAAANNRGLERVGDCEWVAFLNPDAFPEPDWLEQLYRTAQENPQYQMFSSRQVMAHRVDRIDGAGDEYHVCGLHWRRGYGELFEKFTVGGEVFSACAAAALVRVDVARDVGGFDESFFCYAEDVDLGFRLRLKGYRCFYVPAAVVLHVGSAVTGKSSDFSTYHAHRNLVWVYLKNMPSSLLLIYLPQHLLLNFIEIFWFTLRGQGRVILKAKWDALRGLSRVLKQRKEVQKSRRVSVRELRRVMVKGVLTPYLRRLS